MENLLSPRVSHSNAVRNPAQTHLSTLHPKTLFPGTVYVSQERLGLAIKKEVT